MLRLKVQICFYSIFFIEPVRFGSVFSVSGLPNRNRIEPAGFLKILIGLIGFFSRFGFFGYFFSGFLGLIGFSVFLLTPIEKVLVLSNICFVNKYHVNKLENIVSTQKCK